VTDAELPGRAPFDEPWQARLFGTAVATVDALDLPWDAFRDRLKDAVAAAPARPYFETFLAAFEQLLADEAGLALPAGR
jgi:hypothetical protein